MARTVHQLAVLTVGALIGFLPAVTPPPAPPTPQVITLPPGVELPPGTYDVVVSGGGQSVQVTATIGEAAPAATPEATDEPVAPGVGGGVGSALVTTLLGVLALVGVGMAAYVGFVRPRRRMAAYRQTVDLIAAGRYRQALPRLTELEAQLPRGTRAEARFFIAFALYRSGDGDGAVYHLTALHKERPEDRDVAHLLAYLRMEQRRYEEAERVLQAVDPTGRLDDARMRKLRGVITFHRARQLLRDGRVDTAAQMFEQAEQFGGFGDRVPDDLRSRHIVLGTRALFEKDLTTARTQFEGLIEAVGTGSTADAWMGAMAELGLALATWIESPPGSPTAVESRLTDVVRRLDAEAEAEEAWPEAADGPSLVEQLEALDQASDGDDREAKPTRLLRDIHFLRGMAVLRAWAEAESPARDSDIMLPRAISRFACARRLDPQFADTYLVVGMLRYHFARSPAERARATAELQQARKLGARDPELLRILNRQKRADEDGGDHDVRVFDRFVTDGSLPQQVRTDLLRKLSRFGKARSSDERPELALPERSAPTVTELKDRSELLGARVSRLLAQRPSLDGHEDLATARDLARTLEDDSRALSEQAESIERREAQLLMMLANWLLPEGEGQR